MWRKVAFNELVERREAVGSQHEDARLRACVSVFRDPIDMTVANGPPAQASFVAVLLLAFVNTDHWRSHGVTLVCNFGLLFACIAFRREQIRGREAV